MLNENKKNANTRKTHQNNEIIVNKVNGNKKIREKHSSKSEIW